MKEGEGGVVLDTSGEREDFKKFQKVCQKTFSKIVIFTNDKY